MPEPPADPRTRVGSAADRGFFALFAWLLTSLEDLNAHVDEHLAHINALEDQGVLVAAGPFLGAEGANSGDGLIIVRASDQAEAEEIAAGDPFHRLGIRKNEVRRWQLNEGHLNIVVDLARGTGDLR